LLAFEAMPGAGDDATAYNGSSEPSASFVCQAGGLRGSRGGAAIGRAPHQRV